MALRFFSVFPRFLKKNKTDRSLRFPGVFKRFYQHWLFLANYPSARDGWDGMGKWLWAERKTPNRRKPNGPDRDVPSVLWRIHILRKISRISCRVCGDLHYTAHCAWWPAVHRA